MAIWEEVVARNGRPKLATYLPENTSLSPTAELHSGFPTARRECEDSLLRKLEHTAPRLHWTARESSDRIGRRGGGSMCSRPVILQDKIVQMRPISVDMASTEHGLTSCSFISRAHDPDDGEIIM